MSQVVQVRSSRYLYASSAASGSCLPSDLSSSPLRREGDACDCSRDLAKTLFDRRKQIIRSSRPGPHRSPFDAPTSPDRLAQPVALPSKAPRMPRNNKHTVKFIRRDRSLLVERSCGRRIVYAVVIRLRCQAYDPSKTGDHTTERNPYASRRSPWRCVSPETRKRASAENHPVPRPRGSVSMFSAMGPDPDAKP